MESLSFRVLPVRLACSWEHGRPKASARSRNNGYIKGFKPRSEFTKDNRNAIFIAEKPKGKKGISLMLPMNVFAQIMNSFSEQSFFDHQISQEQYLLCKNEAGVIEVRHVE